MKKIRILGIDYEVIHESTDANGSNNAGQVNNTGCVIRICNNMNSDEHAKCVLLHEIIEAVKYRLELNLEHRDITSLESSLFQVFKDNPKLVDHLFK